MGKILRLPAVKTAAAAVMKEDRAPAINNSKPKKQTKMKRRILAAHFAMSLGIISMKIAALNSRGLVLTKSMKGKTAEEPDVLARAAYGFLKIPLYFVHSWLILEKSVRRQGGDLTIRC